MRSQTSLSFWSEKLITSYTSCLSVHIPAFSHTQYAPLYLAQYINVNQNLPLSGFINLVSSNLVGLSGQGISHMQIHYNQKQNS
jgi:hypothetical protein